MIRGNDPICTVSARGMGFESRDKMEIIMTSKFLIAAAVAAALATPAFAQGREEFETQAPAQVHQQIFEGRNAAVIQAPIAGPDRAEVLGN
jgi:hypothetical protein